jgi:hypothetical protein
MPTAVFYRSTQPSLVVVTTLRYSKPVRLEKNLLTAYLATASFLGTVGMAVQRILLLLMAILTLLKR